MGSHNMTLVGYTGHRRHRRPLLLGQAPSLPAHERTPSDE